MTDIVEKTSFASPFGPKKVWEMSDIFRHYAPAYIKQHKLPLRMHRVINAIVQCRTAKLGGHVYQCEECGYKVIVYNSCRNRHCPKCQILAREKWLADREKELLPIKYFHLIFTIPDDLNPLILHNQKELYTILFKSSSETLLELSKDPKHLGAQIGFISILHTWGQNLMHHPHIHTIVTGGGLSSDTKRWKTCKKEFFIQVKVISKMFRGKFMYYLKKAYKKNSLITEGKIRELRNRWKFQEIVDRLYKKKWVVYAKSPFQRPEDVLNYLGRYTHRVAISNNRIVKVENHKVTFRWKDYKNGNRNKLMTLDVFEFIRRFLLHILPEKFVKIRHYGILSNRNKKAKLKRCREILGRITERVNKAFEDIFYELTGIKYYICPVCGKGIMIKREVILPDIHGPPLYEQFSA